MKNRALATFVAATLLTGLAVTTVAVNGAGAATRGQAISSAAAYGKSHGYFMGLAVLDTKTGQYYHGGAAQTSFASESVVKTMIATRLLLQGRMHGSTASRAYKMITQSDDAIASAFYGSVGGDSLINWIKQHYRIPELGSPPRRAGWWGNTHITARGLVWFYAKVKKDPKVGPWLMNAMHHATKYGSDGTYQFFGLPSATSGAGIKQGWGDDFDDWSRSADFNSTGFVDGDRYAVALLARGPIGTYGSKIGNALTQVAKRLLPGGRFPDDTPTVTSLSATTGATSGGQRITVRGSNFSAVSSVVFGSVRGSGVKVLSSTVLQVTTPKHAASAVIVKVATSHGTSGTVRAARFVFVSPPTVTAIAPTSGSAAGGRTVTVHGSNFTRVTKVTFGALAGSKVHVSSSTSLTVVAPKHGAGVVDVRVASSYGTSTATSTDRFTYWGPPTVTNLAPVTEVDFGTAVVAVPAHTGNTVTVTAPAHAEGAVDARVRSPYGTSAAVAYTYGP
jgi:hypothetical protein